MLVASFQENSPGWQFELVRQKLEEWWEFKISQVEINSPNLSIFDSPFIQSAIKFILWSLIAVILVWVTWQLWLLLRPIINDWRRQKQRLKGSQYLKEPIQPQLSPQQWLTKAREYYLEQNYRQGIFCLYQGILQYLGDRKIIDNLSSRTDGEYLKIIQQLKLARFVSYKLLFSTHEQLCFSSLFPSATMFDRCEKAYHEITTNQDNETV